MKQLHDLECFKPINVKDVSKSENRKAIESLLFLVEKRDGRIKARHCANRKLQRQWMDWEDVSSPTDSTESTLITSIIDAKEGRDVGTCDIPNAFVQTKMNPTDKHGDRIIMKIRGVLVDILCELYNVYNDYIVWENKGRDKVLYTHVTKALYGLLESAMLFYKKLVKDLQHYGFELNLYDPCVANKIVKGNQMTVSWHVDDLKGSHVNPNEIDLFLKWVQETYGSIAKVKSTRGKIHD